MFNLPGIWMGVCESCLANYAVWPNPEKAANFPGPDDWVEPIACPVCRGNIEWAFNTLGGTK